MATKQTDASLCESAGVSRPTLAKWKARPDFPKPGRDGRIDDVTWAEYAKARNQEALKAQTGRDTDLKRVKLSKQIELLDIDIQTKRRDAELHKIEHEAKRGMWFSVDQVKELAAHVAGSFDESVSAVEMITRDAKAVRGVREVFDRIRERLAEQLVAK